MATITLDQMPTTEQAKFALGVMKGMYALSAEGTLTDAAVVTPDFTSTLNYFLQFTAAVGATRQLGNPTYTGPVPIGLEGAIRCAQDSAGSRTMTFGSFWKRSGGAPSFSTTANSIDVILFKIIASNYILYDLRLNPT